MGTPWTGQAAWPFTLCISELSTPLLSRVLNLCRAAGGAGSTWGGLGRLHLVLSPSTRTAAANTTARGSDNGPVALTALELEVQDSVPGKSPLPGFSLGPRMAEGASAGISSFLVGRPSCRGPILMT